MSQVNTYPIKYLFVAKGVNFFLLTIALVVMCLTLASCHPNIKQGMSQLQKDMTKGQVEKIFAKYDVLRAGKESRVLTNSLTKCFQNKELSSSWVVYVPRGRSLFNFENCCVFFDNKGIIIGYLYGNPSTNDR